MRAWGRLKIDERKAAVAAIPAFKAEWERIGRTMAISGWRYLEERKWEALKPVAVGFTEFKALTRDWWALLLQIDRGEKIGAFVGHTLGSNGTWVCKFDDMPPFARIQALARYPSEGEAMNSWRPWLEQRGVRVTARDTLWVFLPSSQPPINSSVWKEQCDAG